MIAATLLDVLEEHVTGCRDTAKDILDASDEKVAESWTHGRISAFEEVIRLCRTLRTTLKTDKP